MIPTVTIKDVDVSGHIATPELAKHVGKRVRLKTPCGDIVALVKDACDSSDWDEICVDVELEFKHGIKINAGSTIPKHDNLGGACVSEVDYTSAPDYFPKDKHAFTWWDFLALSLENK